jgi:hypothetical protein
LGWFWIWGKGVCGFLRVNFGKFAAVSHVELETAPSAISQKFFVFILLLIATSCVFSRSPLIHFNNLSEEVIRNIEVKWNQERMDGYPSELQPGVGVVESFPLPFKQHFFGPVDIFWENANGDQFSQKLFFSEENLPRIGRKSFDDVLIYFDQNGMWYYTSDDMGFSEIKKRNRDRMYKIWLHHKKDKCEYNLARC